MRIVYFARVREAVGFDGEERDAADNLSIGELIDQLAAENPRYAEAFGNRGKLRFALDQQMVSADAMIGNAQELAIFPPVTGG